MGRHRFVVDLPPSAEAAWELAAREALQRLNKAPTRLFTGLQSGDSWIGKLSLYLPNQMSIDVTNIDEASYLSRCWVFRTEPELVRQFELYRTALIGEVAREKYEVERRNTAYRSKFNLTDWVTLDQNRRDSHENGRLYLEDKLKEQGLRWSAGVSEPLFVVFAYLYSN